MTSKDYTDYGGLAATLNSRLAADSRVSGALGFAWLCGGVGAAALLAGMGSALALYGYSTTLSARPAVEEMAAALSEAIGNAELKATVSGKMALAPTELKLAKQQTIKLEEGATVKLDPNSSVRVVGDLKVDMPQPSKRQLQEEATTRSNELPITSYTIFKSVPYGSGAVDTGWHFDLSDPVRPTGQYCYYRQDITKGLTTKYMLAVNNSPRRPQPLQKLSFDFDEALSNCVWYSGF
jgi:hypothetical protein